jgi:hypothetical protein
VLLDPKYVYQDEFKLGIQQSAMAVSCEEIYYMVELSRQYVFLFERNKRGG